MIGARQLRLEDPGLLTGADRYTADLDVPGALTAVFVRSVMAHARIDSVDTTEAAGAPGVVAVFTAADLDLPAVGIAAFTAMVPAAFRRFPLARSVVRFVGEAVAVVVAETEAQARDAADLVEVDYDPLPALVDPVAAAADGAERLFPDTASNVALHLAYEAGEPCPDATVRVRTLVEHPRMAVAPMEPNAIVAEPGPEGRLTMWVSSQWPHRMRDVTAELLGMAPADLRVVCPAVGGGFGGKTPAEPDYVLVAAIARRLGRPVRWVQTRSENLLTMQPAGTASTSPSRRRRRAACAASRSTC
ncbi:hypothetical protein BJF78_00475 [Pseudonocardia sp. CNS-139]|nr:hypothetical protein BJF78_00475 [Pseudonocardia sp. CNS-139]